MKPAAEQNSKCIVLHFTFSAMTCTFFLYGPRQIPIGTMFPGFYAICWWSPQQSKQGLIGLM